MDILKNQMNIFYRFGQAIHYAIKEHLYRLENPYHAFDARWDKYRDASGWIYKEGESWESLWAKGHQLLTEFMMDFPTLNIEPVLMENRMLSDNLGQEIQPDLVGFDRDSKLAVVDFKVTEKAVWWSDIEEQLFRGAALAKEVFDYNEDVRLIVFNMVKSTGKVKIEERRVESREIDDFITKKKTGGGEGDLFSMLDIIC